MRSTNVCAFSLLILLSKTSADFTSDSLNDSPRPSPSDSLERALNARSQEDAVEDYLKRNEETDYEGVLYGMEYTGPSDVENVSVDDILHKEFRNEYKYRDIVSENSDDKIDPPSTDLWDIFSPNNSLIFDPTTTEDTEEAVVRLNLAGQPCQLGSVKNMEILSTFKNMKPSDRQEIYIYIYMHIFIYILLRLG
ncbi:hypothetical protein AAMO2058_000502900 [Amorphochlora amoebiformis]